MSDYLAPTPSLPDNMRHRPVFRGVTEDHEVLTEQGWVRFDTILESGRALGDEIPFIPRQTTVPKFGVRGWEGGVFALADGFPRVATMDPATGRIFFTQPSQFMWYEQPKTVARIKMKGVDLFMHPHTDLWVRPHYGRGWRYASALDVVKLNRVPQSRFGLLNKFSHDLYGDVDVDGLLGDELVLPSFDGSYVEVLSSSLSVDVLSPIRMFPKKHASLVSVSDHFGWMEMDDFGRMSPISGEARETIRVCNFVAAPFHNIVVRRGRKDVNPRTPWIGGPTIVGDGVDKSLLRVGGVMSAEYRRLHPEWRSMSAAEGARPVVDFGDVRKYGDVG